MRSLWSSFCRSAQRRPFPLWLLIVLVVVLPIQLIDRFTTLTNKSGLSLAWSILMIVFASYLLLLCLVALPSKWRERQERRATPP